ncbi:hypothetical protein [Coleofasciculus sp. F4-SAH-05]|uniref:hypothetical protein n=1 Tax=Coleofasciculus sp. F4-SAH-05 TaxID=3069525 RepID=UPI003303D529
MQAKDSPQHFLDTSVVRSLLLGTQAYRQYLNSNLAERPLYISNYIQKALSHLPVLQGIGIVDLVLGDPTQLNGLELFIDAGGSPLQYQGFHDIAWCDRFLFSNSGKIDCYTRRLLWNGWETA